MKIGWGARRRLRTAAAALVALTLLPVAVLVVSAHPGPGPAPPGPAPFALSARDVETPSVEALQRSEASDLFAPFSWNGVAATGPFVSFGFTPTTGTISGYSAVNRSSVEVLVQTIQIVAFTETMSPQLVGATFVANGLGITLIAHEEPMALLEIETTTPSRSVVLSFPATASGLQVSHATAWPHATLSFEIGGSAGRVILGKGTMTVNGTKVTATLESNDYLALRAVPSFADHIAQRNAILDAFASGRLAAEYDLVAMTNGGWLENAAEYQPDLSLISGGVSFSTAVLTMNTLTSRDGLVLLAFDPRTMPSDAIHELVVTNNGIRVAEAQDPLGPLYASQGASSQASFSQLAMNATVLAIYLPSLAASSLQVESVAMPAPGLDGGTEMAMVAAVFVVSVAAAVMFRPRHP